MQWLWGRRNALAVAIVVILFVTAGYWTVSLLQEERSRALSSLRTGSWITVQSEIESLRLMDALAAYQLGETPDKQALLTRLDIFWSRLPIMLTGSESEIVARIGKRDEVADILSELPALERQLLSFERGDASYGAIRARLDAIRARLHDIVQAVLITDAESASHIRSLETYSTIIAYFSVVLVSGGALFGMLLRQLHRSRVLTEKAQRAATMAEKAALDAVQANETKTRFLAAASHDLRQPLHAAGLLLSALGMRVRGREAIDLVEKIGLSLERISSQLDAYLNISRFDAGAIQPEITSVPLQPILDELVAEFVEQAARKGLQIRTCRTAAWVRTDGALLERALFNLLANAVRYTDSGGILIGCRRKGNRIRIDIIDTGIGIASEEQDRIFREFYQIGNAERASEAGFGLGLSIVERIAALLGHDLDIASIPGRGSRFSIQLPLAEPPDRTETPAGSRVETPAATPGRFRVLVIEDDPLVAESIALVIQDSGCEVATVPSAEAAIDLVREQVFRPEAIAADYRLPGQNGIEAVLGIREILGHPVPGFLMTGEATKEVQVLAEKAGLAFLSKPVLPEQLGRMIASVSPVAA